jgi:lipoate-protein ligase B
MHGLGLNVAPDMNHFGLIVPCGLAGRPVTSLKALLGERCPSMDEVKRVVAESIGMLARARLEEVRRRAEAAREA